MTTRVYVITRLKLAELLTKVIETYGDFCEPYIHPDEVTNAVRHTLEDLDLEEPGRSDSTTELRYDLEPGDLFDVFLMPGAVKGANQDGERSEQGAEKEVSPKYI